MTKENWKFQQSVLEAGVSHTRAAMVAADHAGQLIATLSAALALERDVRLLQAVRVAGKLKPEEHFAIGQRGGPSLIVNGGKVSPHRRKPDGLPLVDTAAFARDGGPIAHVFRAALIETSASTDATELISSLYAPQLPLRRQIRKVLEWAPILEKAAYAAGAALCASLDDIRATVVSGRLDRENERGDLMVYWWQALAFGNLTLITTSPQARHWLVEMAEQFEWINWTPTFPLVRERSLWLAACAARSVAAFGEPVIEKYWKVLATAREAFTVFDALFGLVAIGLAHPGVAPAILIELKLRRRLLNEPKGIVPIAYDDAIGTLAGERKSEQKEVLDLAGIAWRPKSSRGLVTR
ncbi:hypothetical protein, partial [Pseudorhodoplanes sp.]|uniref:hypothetical protein n=1 Tax=Pseudorhodoplanes sp. TaxID=1934341 RepID=UPI003D13E79E